MSETATPGAGPVALIARAGDRAAAVARAVVPDPFVIAIALGFLALVLGAVLGDSPQLAKEGPLSLVRSFADGMMATSLLAFAFQMALILITGHALASAPAVRRLLGAVADLPRAQGAAAATVAATAMTLGLLNWGLGLVGGAFVAREVGRAFARRGERLNYPLVGAAGYVGLLVWHGGLSGSAPLKVASDGEFGPAIDVSATVFSPLNLAVTATLFVVLPALFWALARAPASVEVEAPAGDLEEAPEPDVPGHLHRLENAAVVMVLLAGPIAVAVTWALVDQGAKAINLNFIILAFFALGLVLHRSSMSYARAFGEGTRGAAGILLQFPLYFGILAVARDSGLMVAMARGLSEASIALSGALSPETSASWFTFLSAALINMLVPSGGGQWALQAPVILETAKELDIDRARLVMAFSYGDQLTNMLQPFWALPLLSITRLQAREILGYTMLAMLLAAPVFLLWLALL